MTGSDTMTAVTFCIPQDIKASVDKFAKKTDISSSYFYNHLVSDHIDEFEMLMTLCV